MTEEQIIALATNMTNSFMATIPSNEIQGPEHYSNMYASFFSRYALSQARECAKDYEQQMVVPKAPENDISGLVI